MNSNTSIRLKQIMTERNLKQVDILRKSEPYQQELNIKMSKSTLSQYVNGIQSPDQNRLFLLSKTLDVSEPWLMGYDVPKERIPDKERRKTIDRFTHEYFYLKDAYVDLLKKVGSMKNVTEILGNDKRWISDIKSLMATGDIWAYRKKFNIPEDISNNRIHVYGQTAAGEPEEYVDGFVDEDEVATVPDGANRALRIKGKSMEPLLNDGQIVFYKSQEHLEIGQIGIFEINGNAVTCKKYNIDFENQKIILQSINTDYKDMTFNEDEVRILGHVKV